MTWKQRLAPYALGFPTAFWLTLFFAVPLISVLSVALMTGNPEKGFTLTWNDYDRTVLGQSSYFVWLNRGKESIELDVKSERGHDVMAGRISAGDLSAFVFYAIVSYVYKWVVTFGIIWFFTGTFVENRKWSLSWYTWFAAAEPAGSTYP